jgi:hypothetical protein
MNKQDAVKRIEAIEAEARALRAIIEAPDKPALPTRWKPEDGEYYLYVAPNGNSERTQNCLGRWDADALSHGNCFKTEAHTEIASKAVSQTLKICAAAFAVDPDAGEWMKSARRWCVFKRIAVGGNREWATGNFDFNMGHPCYVHTMAQAEKMAAILNAEGV